MSMCSRCGRGTNVITMSYFNTDLICPKCDDLERAHPDFEHARNIEMEAVKQGDYHFPGIGLPVDLARRS